MVRKNMNLQKLRQALAWTVKEGIFTSTFNMIGFPTETEKEMTGTIDFALNSPVHMAIFFLVTPFRGTALFDLAVAHGFQPGEGAEHLRYHNIVDDSIPWFTLVPRKRIKDLLYEFNMKFYFDHRRLEGLMKVTPGTHGWDQISQFLFNRMTELNLTADKIPDPKARRLIFKIIEKGNKPCPLTREPLPVQHYETALKHPVVKLRIQIPFAKGLPGRSRREPSPPVKAPEKAVRP
jgi:hypothetical protein